jgi:hypothetical protein
MHSLRADPRVEDVPGHVMLAVSGSTAAKRVAQDDTLLDLGHVQQPPASGTRIGRRWPHAPQLIYEQPVDAILDAVVMGLGDPTLALVTELDEAFALDCGSQLFVHVV